MEDALAARIEKIERRLRSLEEKEAVLDCINRYCMAVDLRQDDAFVGNLTADCVIDLGDEAGAQWRGRDGARLFLDESVGPAPAVPRYRALHVSGRLAVEISGDTASAEGYSAVLALRRGEHQILTCGFNHWDLARENGHWRVRRRRRRAIGGADGPNVMVNVVRQLDELASAGVDPQAEAL
ncbi:SnoaL-like protein [Methylovirgula ligni]|uniref:SnoaL-like protein n=1 Tax=Methylovirgula ligni TaxID=569860 RepID=A0A3D9Z4F2_9HYPH|nr:nuclear transport factor 2 family protein [Methylovirgula ligni]REF89178.1 SnoaL-like protein [Methylovirgula ligni]